MSNVPMAGSNCSSMINIVNPEKNKGEISIHQVMTPVCVGCRRKISGKDGMFLYLPDPYFAVIHKECAPFYHFLGVWPHSQSFYHYAGKSLRPQVLPGKTPSPGTT